MAKQKTEEKLVSVEFVKPWGRYSKGDIAGFDADKAGKLIASKAAVEPGKAEAEKTAE